MTSPLHRYRIAITPIETDGHQCPGRCSIELDQRSHQDWTRQLEALQRQRSLVGNHDAAVVLATGLLRNLADAAASRPHPVLAALQPELDALLAKLDALQAGT